MKKILVLLSVLLLSGCAPDALLVAQREFSPSSLTEISPVGLVYQERIGKNWWKGRFEDRKVLIHAVPTHAYVNVDIIFLD